MRSILYPILLLAFVSAAGVDEPPRQPAKATPPPVEKSLYWNLKAVFRRHYEGFASHQLDNKLHFERDTRIFVLHLPLKTGEWQDPVERRGPRRNGVYCDIEVRAGHWKGAAMVPQRFDRHYYYVYLMAPYSAKRDCHLYVRLLVPKHGVPESFLGEFTSVVNKCDEYSFPKPR